MSQVTNNLFISGYNFASDRQALERHGISHIVNMTFEYRNSFPEEFHYLRVQAKDVLSQRLGPRFREIAAFVASATNSGRKALVHCQLGVSRSASGVLACLMINDRMRLADAIQLLRSRKHDVDPNPAFVRELRALEMELFGVTSKEKISIMDTCEPVVPLDWKESTAVLLSEAATSSATLDRSSKEYQCIVATFRAVTRGRTTDLYGIICDMIITSLESYAAQNLRDGRARTALEEILVLGFTSEGLLTVGQLWDAVQGTLNSEEFRDYMIDVPRAKGWTQEFLNRLPVDRVHAQRV